MDKYETNKWIVHAEDAWSNYLEATQGQMPDFPYPIFRAGFLAAIRRHAPGVAAPSLEKWAAEQEQ